MKIQLIRTEELDGIWYKILIDGCVKKCFGCKYVEEATAKESAKQMYDNIIKNHTFITEIIEEAEI